jgi:hypothetical protein
MDEIRSSYNVICVDKLTDLNFILDISMFALSLCLIKITLYLISCAAQDHPSRRLNNVQRPSGRIQGPGLRCRWTVRGPFALCVWRRQRCTCHTRPTRVPFKRQPLARGRYIASMKLQLYASRTTQVDSGVAPRRTACASFIPFACTWQQPVGNMKLLQRTSK